MTGKGEKSIGTCGHCGSEFHWYLIHNGFNNSCHAYCSDCGITAVLSLYAPQLRNSKNAGTGEISAEIEPLLKPCVCGGRFAVGGKPRCPRCKQVLSAEAAAVYIEAGSAGTRRGWRWQRTWNGPWALYCILIDDCAVYDIFCD